MPSNTRVSADCLRKGRRLQTHSRAAARAADMPGELALPMGTVLPGGTPISVTQKGNLGS